jgi:hypothetical protein
VLASKILTGETPNVLSAIHFEAKKKQDGLRPIAVAGKTIDPATDDFYQRLIIHRNTLKARCKDPHETDKPTLKSDEKGVKILANATSYGIFVELHFSRNVLPTFGQVQGRYFADNLSYIKRLPHSPR